MKMKKCNICKILLHPNYVDYECIDCNRFICEGCLEIDTRRIDSKSCHVVICIECYYKK